MTAAIVAGGSPSAAAIRARVRVRHAGRLVRDLMTTAPLSVQRQAEDFARRIGSPNDQDDFV